MKKILVLILTGILTLSLFAGCNNNSGASSNNTAEKTKYVVGLDPEFPPMGFNDNGELVGFDIDLAKAVAEEMGVEFEFKSIDWDSKELEINGDKIDLIWNGFSITDERKETFELSKPYLKNAQVVVVPVDSTIKTIEDLEGKKVLLQKGSSALNAIEKDPIYDKVGEIAPYPTNMECFQELDIGRGDAIVVDEVVGKYYIAKNAEGKFIVLDDKMQEEDYAIAAKKGNTELISKIEDAISKLYKDGKTKEISTEWFGEDIFYWES